MARLWEQFEPRERERICFVGLGNCDYGDDGFGVRLASELMKAGVPHVVIAGTAPEEYLGQIAAENFDSVMFLDALDFGAPPGSLVAVEAPEMEARFPQISTHKISLAVLSKLLQSNGRTKVCLLGVQPESIRQGRPMTHTVQGTLEIVKELLLDGCSYKDIVEPAEQYRAMETHVC